MRVWKARATCRDGHLLGERLFRPPPGPAGATAVEDALIALQQGCPAWCPACGTDETFYEAQPTRFVSEAAARSGLFAAEAN